MWNVGNISVTVTGNSKYIKLQLTGKSSHN